jgi:hypothetical protein
VPARYVLGALTQSTLRSSLRDQCEALYRRFAGLRESAEWGEKILSRPARCHRMRKTANSASKQHCIAGTTAFLNGEPHGKGGDACFTVGEACFPCRTALGTAGEERAVPS